MKRGKKSKRRKNVFVMALDGRRRQVDCLLDDSCVSIVAATVHSICLL